MKEKRERTKEQRERTEREREIERDRMTADRVIVKHARICMCVCPFGFESKPPDVLSQRY